MNGTARKAPNAEAWEEYRGEPYNSARGYGWLTERIEGRERDLHARIVLADGTETSPHELRRPELASWQGTHQENIPVVFRVDLPNGWYRVTCSSVDPGGRLPLVDQRSFKCRAHDVVFAGPRYGAPLIAPGSQLIENAHPVEVTDGHLRIVVGDPAYAGWVWKHDGPWYRGWSRWLEHDHQYAAGWYQKLTRRVDPGFHSLRVNSLEVNRMPPRLPRDPVVFRDFFNRDDSPQLSVGLPPSQRWKQVKLHPRFPDGMIADLYRTSIRITGPREKTGNIGLLQPMPSPVTGVIRYTTRVSLFTGEGSRKHKGVQEAGVLLLADPSAPTEYGATFLGIAVDTNGSGVSGRLIYRVGDGKRGYRTNLEIPDSMLSFRIREGEYEFTVEHDLARGQLRRIAVNGVDLTSRFSESARKQRLRQGLFGIRSMMSAVAGARLKQFYWVYRVEQSEIKAKLNRHFVANRSCSS